MNDVNTEKNHQDAMFLMQQSDIAWKNMWLIFIISVILILIINPAAFRSHFFIAGLAVYILCALISTYPMRHFASTENIITFWYFRVISELLFMFLIINYTGREKSVMIIGIGAMLLRFIICRPYLKEVLSVGIFMTLMETSILFTRHSFTNLAFSRSYLAALCLFWFTIFYVYWGIKQFYREKDMLTEKNIKNQLLIKELQMEKKLHLSEKFATIGQLAAGLAHEIRNPLTAIQGFVQLLRNRNLADKEKEYLDIIHDELLRVGGLMREFLLLAKPAAPQCKNQPAGAIVSEVSNLMQSEALIREIRLVSEGARDCLINVDREQIKQVIINLIKNALEVVEKGKQITLSVDYNSVDMRCFIRVKDEGPGIPADILKQIFDPFFTTKEEGTGLGLAVSFRIVENHGGKLSVRSVPGQGSEFTIELPAGAPPDDDGRLNFPGIRASVEPSS